jgi:hypothetical protein
MWVRSKGAGPTANMFSPNKVYCVYGLRIGGSLEFFLSGERYEIPSSYSALHFEVVEPRVSSRWVLGPVTLRTSASGASESVFLLTFREWALRPMFYDDLVNGTGDASKIFREHRQFMELEFSRPDVVSEAANLGKGWVQCAKCSGAWEPSHGMELGICARCGEVQKLPLNRSSCSCDANSSGCSNG